MLEAKLKMHRKIDKGQLKIRIWRVDIWNVEDVIIIRHIIAGVSAWIYQMEKHVPTVYML